MTELERVKQEIKMLQSKLSFLEELEKHKKTPAEEAFKKFYGEYPPTTPSVDNHHVLRWAYFKAGYEAAQAKDAREYQPSPQTPEENEWKDVALKFGKKLPVILPYNYDELSPNSWFRWAVFTYDNYMKQRDIESGYQPSPQTHEEVAEGLRNAMIQAKKEGVFDEPKFTEPPTLYEIIADWWCEDWTGSNTKICEDLLNRIEKWLPEEFLSYGEYGDGWNDCLKYIKENSND